MIAWQAIARGLRRPTLSSVANALASDPTWQAIQRRLVGQLDSGAILEGAEEFQRIAQTRGLPRDSH